MVQTNTGNNLRNKIGIQNITIQVLLIVESIEREKSPQWVHVLAEESVSLFFQENVPLGSVLVLWPNTSPSTSIFMDSRL